MERFGLQLGRSQLGRSKFGKNGRKLRDRKVEVLGRDNERRGEPDAAPVRVFRQNPASKKQLADLATGRKPGVNVDSGPEPDPANRKHPVADKGRKTRVQAHPKLA